jgi:hypothetical protein
VTDLLDKDPEEVRSTGYREHRLLLPSRARHYSNQARLLGYGLDRTCISVELDRWSTVRPAPAVDVRQSRLSPP